MTAPTESSSLGDSRSFPASHAFVEQADARGRIARLHRRRCRRRVRRGRRAALPAPSSRSNWAHECLGVHTGEHKGQEGSNVVGFARFRLGRADPSRWSNWCASRRPATPPIAAAKAAFEAAGLKVAVCGDFPGRIIDRLIRPYLNAALRRLDEKTGERRRHGQDAVPGPRLPGRSDLAAGAHRPGRTS